MKKISTDFAPEAIGPYSQAVSAAGFVFCSGQIPLTVAGELVLGDIEAQVKQVMENLGAVLKEAGCGYENIVKTTIYLSDMENFGAVNEVYASYFQGGHRPARATVEVSRLPKDVLVEIDCIAAV